MSGSLDCSRFPASNFDLELPQARANIRAMFRPTTSPPKTLSPEEQSRLLEVIATRGSRRDLALLTVALATGLRLKELLGLNVGDVVTRSGEVAWRVELAKRITKGRRGGVAFLSERARGVLRDFLLAKRVMRESMAQEAPLFRSNMTRRLSLRRVQVIFDRWQREAGFETHYNFHTLRHTAVTNVYRATKDLFLTQRFARHASPVTTVAYTHPTDEELYSKISQV